MFTQTSRNSNKENVLVFDIETIPQVSPFSDIQEEKLQLKIAKVMKTDDTLDLESARRLVAGTSPFFAEIICVGIYENSLRFPQGKEHIIKVPVKNIDNVLYPDEKDLLERWWTYIRTFTGAFVGYNSINFDSYLLITRSMKHRILPTNKQFLNLKKFSVYPHVDILEHLANWNYLNRVTLNQACDFFNIPSPKEGTVRASEVQQAFQEDRLDEIAAYCLRDVKSTYELYKIVKNYNR